jgi:methionyl-tRNA formyltransferase
MGLHISEQSRILKQTLVMTKVLVITTGLSSFVSKLISCEALSITGILDCHESDKLKEFAKEQNIPYKKMEKQDSLLTQWIKEKNPDVIAVFKMPFLLKREIFSLPEYGSLNLHPSLLPHYRGPNPWFWIFYNMEKESGVTVHFIDEGEDTGDIIYQQKITIPTGAKLDELKKEFFNIGIDMMIKALCNIEHIKAIPQPVSSPTMRARNIYSYNDLIDWNNWNVEKIWHLLNGFPEILLTNKSYLSLNKDLMPDSYYMKNVNGPIGEITFIDNSYILKCTDGIIKFMV